MTKHQSDQIFFLGKYECIQREVWMHRVQLNPKQSTFPFLYESYLHASLGYSRRQNDYGSERGNISGYFKFFQILALHTCSWKHLGIPFHCNLKEYGYYPVRFSASKWDFFFFFHSVTKPLPARRPRNYFFFLSHLFQVLAFFLSVIYHFRRT